MKFKIFHNVNETFLSDYDGRTALHLAAAEGHVDCVQFLLEQCGVPHNPKDRWGNTPLDEAETFEHEKVAEYLRSFDEKAAKTAPFINTPPVFSVDKDQDDVMRKSISADSLYDKSDASSPVPPPSENGKVF